VVRSCCRTLCLTLAAIGAVSAAAGADPPFMLYDLGATSPIAPYARAFNARPLGPTRTVPHRHSVATFGGMFPIITPELSPGEVEPRAILLPHLPRPFFLVGADQRSLRWLEARRERLRALRAIGLLIQARDEADLRAAIEAAGGLPILPVSGSDIARHLLLTHYPVLIGPDRLEP